MTLEDPTTIDLTLKPKDGKQMLLIIDSGVTTDPNERMQLLINKLKAYVAYVMSDEFKQNSPGINPRDITIRVVCKTEPTDQMKQIDKIMPHGDRENMITVEYELLG